MALAGGVDLKMGAPAVGGEGGGGITGRFQGVSCAPWGEWAGRLRGLGADEALEYGFESRAAVGKRDVGRDLVGGIAKPHGVDVAGDDERVGPPTVIGSEDDRGVEGVGKTVLEKPGELGIDDVSTGV